ncbi:hypothetical protein MWU78_01900 [Arenibacter sp. F26102]|uniref:DUF6786 family protein n=1 Tax=Arenibacter sp. F26102 TaxID=2926416 RepID=UPI001FF2967F|nr:DUF6786 family protein [Arenibacter sp. F26102]MCK0144400.1 hypothetical protein [Arenibacter sp. F26102]
MVRKVYFLEFKNIVGTVLLCCFLCLVSCKTKNEQGANVVGVEKEGYAKGTFGYDREFLMEHYKDLVLLENGESSILISPELQGRVMTSTAKGNEGKSFGWINHDLITSGEINEHFNPTGGEERFWLGPEGGQNSIFFEKDTKFEFDNWYVPKELDIEAFNFVDSNENQAFFEREMKLVNYTGTTFELKVQRNIKLLDKEDASEILGLLIPEKVSMVGFASENSITNLGSERWDKKTGLLSIWILSMFNSSDETTIIVPFKKGDVEHLGNKVTDDYFGKIPKERLQVHDSVLFFKADGKERGKIGISPQRALPVLGSYDAKNKVLTIAKFSLPEGVRDYVNSQWELQEFPYSGDAVNAYNDGPLEDGGQLGPFYELESSSPALDLKSDEKSTHVHQTFHFVGDDGDLEKLARDILGVSLKGIAEQQ